MTALSIGLGWVGGSPGLLQTERLMMLWLEVQTEELSSNRWHVKPGPQVWGLWSAQGTSPGTRPVPENLLFPWESERK